VPSREVDVHRFELERRDGDILDLHVECGSGTYVRSLARDLGERLGCGAHLVALRRLWIEPFHAPIMRTLDELESISTGGGMAGLDRVLLPLETGLSGLPELNLSDADAQRLRHGQRVALTGAQACALARACDARGKLVALVEVDDAGEVRVRRGFATSD
jgi:tRNA pseudouridine55 synthase